MLLAASLSFVTVINRAGIDRVRSVGENHSAGLFVAL
jgi:hypothetical protein